jgi:hypothetical protein
VSHVFFTDRDLGKRFLEIPTAAGLRVERHADDFAPTTPDADWLEAMGNRGWTITLDARIRYKPHELAAAMQHRVRLLVVVGAAPFPELAKHFAATHTRIEAFLAEHAALFIAKVYRPSPGDKSTSGSVALSHPR